MYWLLRNPFRFCHPQKMFMEIQFQNEIADGNRNSPNSKYGSPCPVGANVLPFLNFVLIIFLDIGLLAGC
jgi:hypothetical protein